ncbi:MAG: VWA domain-containing protein [Pirellulales bacterium]
MNNISFSFEYPWMLALLIVLPVLWISSYGSLSGLGAGRRLAALTFRSLLVSLLIFALAGVQWVWTSDKLTVIYLLDQSDSIARAKRDVMLRYAIDSVREHRRETRSDRAGLIVFGREAAIEFPPFDDDLPDVKAVESNLGRTDATNLEAALKLAQASFPEDSAKRVVIVTDGVETIGSASNIAKSMAEAGIGIDVVPIDLSAKSEILVEKVELPSEIRQGQPFETRVVVQRYQEGNDTPVTGRLKVMRMVGPQESILVDQPVTLDRDVNVFPIRDTIDQPGGYTYRAEFVREGVETDALLQNNRADAFTFVRGKGRILLIEDWQTPGEYSEMVKTLREAMLEVDVRGSNNLFTSLAELQTYDCIILAGVPRSSGENADNLAAFTDEQIEMLVRNTEQFGCGIVMLGGPNAFGAGGWTNTALEKAMPVDFQIKNTKVEAVGALAMVMHASEIAQGNHWQKRIARAALEVLGPSDYCGVVEFGGSVDRWLWGDQTGMMKVGPNRQAMLSRISSMTPQDMPDFDPAMRLALASLTKTPASMKHMIMISDGDPSAPSAGILQNFKAQQIKISTVAVGAHGAAGHQTLQKIATTTGGNYYVATNPSALPKIFMREAMRVSRQLVYEPDGGVKPYINAPHEILQGLDRQLPKLNGFVLTTVKQSPLVEVAIKSDKSIGEEHKTILATWSYGLGRTTVFTSDTGKRWATPWTQWDGYDQLFTQMVRWTMRPTKSDAKFTVATTFDDGRVEVVVNALNQEDEFLNFLDMSAVAVGPDLKPLPVVMRQAAPGRYVGTFDADAAGSYLLNVAPGPGMAPITTGVSIPFSEEYRIRQTNLPALNQIASMRPAGGDSGIITDSLDPMSMQELLKTDTYRSGLPKARSLQDIWPWCVLFCAVCLFSDVFVRRVALDYAYPIKWVAAKMRPKVTQQDAARQQSLERLRGRKSEVSHELDQQRAATRFEVTGPVDASALDEATGAKSSLDRTSGPASAPTLQDAPKGEGYTSRLLAAKKEAQRKTGGSKGNDEL